MDITYVAFQTLRLLKNEKIDDELARKMAIQDLEYCLKSIEDNVQTKDWLIKQAIDSGADKFRLIGRVNTSGSELMEWCDEAWNFNGMCRNKKELEGYKDGEYLKNTYTLEELPKVIERALEWYNSCKADNKFNSTNLHILCID